jgi:hypothetical protein
VIKYPSKKWEETDVEIAITHCGVCGSDVHTITGGWGDIPLPTVVGHEIIGIAKRVGNQVKSGIKVGDRVGVGAQIASCYECKLCKTDNENYCAKKVDTYVRISYIYVLLSLDADTTFLLVRRPASTPTAPAPRAATLPASSPTSSSSSLSRKVSSRRTPLACSVPASPSSARSFGTALVRVRRSALSVSVVL